jgi:hypothetical protein
MPKLTGAPPTSRLSDKGEQTMRAYLIDPELRTITEIDFAGGYKNIQEVVGCEEFTTGSRPLNGSLSKGFDAIYISDDCLDHDEYLNDWFQVDAGREPSPRRGLVIGTDTEGDDCDASISFEELTRAHHIPRRNSSRISSASAKSSWASKAGTHNPREEFGRESWFGNFATSKKGKLPAGCQSSSSTGYRGEIANARFIDRRRSAKGDRVRLRQQSRWD